MRSHLAQLGFIICLRHRGDRPLLPQASTIRLAAVCPALPVLLPLLRLSVGGRYPCLNVGQHNGGVGLKSHRLHFPSSYLSLAASLILIMDIRSSSVCVCFSHVWCGRPAEDDLSGQSYHPFGRVGIITIEWCPH